ncbi:Sapep family Mn(2+)-dependent dipeptidase [Spiroplasma sp. SV19]|uniref:Sapep family Mn(2+)-dependent dipeptidase n=1 Tax=Spiroplasma sp. SV19 TaxID=2570468 RepID=UPI0024B867D6|nr:Sapep family Mn(2+)-dependent dipeptidase [Spiroplasma sp. SV19]WHQ36758.1 Sapep family Mn(2+)-dependent dipeptidase [Spiroplasma sp. SV19]
MEIDVIKLQEKYFSEALTKIQDIIQIPSVRSAAEPNAPFGAGTKAVLDYAINLATELGFKTYQDPENRYGYVEYGTGSEIFAILGHLDVVPAGDLKKWDFEPFQAQIKDGKLLGRGSFDDKGPTIINLYALKYLKDHNYQPDYCIRLIFGLTEETDWASINAYMTTEGTPALGYTPDGEFPVVYAEKGIINADIIGEVEKFILLGGEAYNCVTDVVRYQGPYLAEIKAKLDQKQIETTLEDGWLIVKGKASHGSLPERGINAALVTLATYAELTTDSPIANFVKKHLYNDFNFSQIFPTMKDETGSLIVNNGIVEINAKKTRLTLNMRVPISYQLQDVEEPLIAELAKYHLQLTKISWEKPIHMPLDSFMIKNIMQVYRDVTGDQDAKPVAIGGGTYAKAMPNCVAFGAEFDINESTMHAYNEYVKISDLQKMLEIYTKAISLLTTK